jgi:integrase
MTPPESVEFRGDAVTKSTTSSQANKPAKPYEGFPLFAHATRRWAKKIRGKFHYFGPWRDPQAALDRFNREWPFLSKGRTPPAIDVGDDCTLRTLCNSFLTSKRNKLDAGELNPRSFEDYFQTCDVLISHFGKERQVDDLRSDDFASLRKAMAQRWGPVRLRNTITRVRMLFKFAVDERLIEHAIHYGQSFAPPSAKTLRKARNEAGPRLFEADELRQILDKADPILTAMVFLGVNCGFGNTDVATLPHSAVDLDGGWINFPRPKTEVHRRIPLWSETVKSLREAIENRPAAKDRVDDDLCFLTIRGTRFVRVTPKKSDPSRYSRRDQVSTRFASLLKELGINRRKGLGFYTMRHVFETIGGESGDQIVVNAIMGHVDSTMAGVYREYISDERLRAVTELIHDWLLPDHAAEDATFNSDNEIEESLE